MKAFTSPFPQVELYRRFMDYVQADIQQERRLVNRRMFSVFFWCFIVPTVTATVLMFLIKIGLLPRRIGHYMDWLIVVFPVAYALYVLSLDVLRELPAAIRRGGIASLIDRAVDEEEWRSRVCQEMKQRFFNAETPEEWQRIDSLDAKSDLTWTPSSILSWFENSSSSLYQFVGLGLFLVLLYLSGSRPHQTLSRYYHCASLLLPKS
jgi:predicted PurR-regulated permease PerM